MPNPEPPACYRPPFGRSLRLADLTVLVVVALLCSAIALPLYNRMLLGSFHRSLAHARGVPVLAYDYLFVVLISLLTVACVKIVGAVLVEALLVIPAVAARNISRSLRQFVGFSIAIATISCLAGVIVPMQFDLTVPSGAAIVLVAALFFFASVAARGRPRLSAGLIIAAHGSFRVECHGCLQPIFHR